MWSRSLIKTETLEKYNKYSVSHGLKMWLVYDKALKSLLEMDRIKTETFEKYNTYAAQHNLDISTVFEMALKSLSSEGKQR